MFVLWYLYHIVAVGHYLCTSLPIHYLPLLVPISTDLKASKGACNARTGWCQRRWNQHLVCAPCFCSRRLCSGQPAKNERFFVVGQEFTFSHTIPQCRLSRTPLIHAFRTCCALLVLCSSSFTSRTWNLKEFVLKLSSCCIHQYIAHYSGKKHSAV